MYDILKNLKNCDDIKVSKILKNYFQKFGTLSIKFELKSYEHLNIEKSIENQ